MFGAGVFQFTVGITTDTDCAPLIADFIKVFYNKMKRSYLVLLISRFDILMMLFYQINRILVILLISPIKNGHEIRNMRDTVRSEETLRMKLDNKRDENKHELSRTIYDIGTLFGSSTNRLSVNHTFPL